MRHAHPCGTYVAGIAAGRAAVALSVNGGAPPLCRAHAEMLASLDATTCDVAALVVAAFPLTEGEPS